MRKIKARGGHTSKADNKTRGFHMSKADENPECPGVRQIKETRGGHTSKADKDQRWANE